MSARKNRPDKHGARPDKHGALENLLFCKLADKLLKQEAEKPGNDHYVGWPDMKVAEAMRKRGLLRASLRATGCFHLTDLFRQQFALADLVRGEC